jgi:hypothetical protein
MEGYEDAPYEVKAHAWPIRRWTDDETAVNGISVLVEDDDREIGYEIILDTADMRKLVNEYLRVLSQVANGEAWSPNLNPDDIIKTRPPYGQPEPIIEDPVEDHACKCSHLPPLGPYGVSPRAGRSCA